MLLVANNTGKSIAPSDYILAWDCSQAIWSTTVHIIAIISFTLTYMPCYLTNFNSKIVPVLMCIRITMVYNRSKVKDYIQKKTHLSFPIWNQINLYQMRKFLKSRQ